MHTVYTAVTQKYSKAVILDGVPTHKLSYWTGNEGRVGHYNVAVGVDLNTNKILVGEVYGKYNRGNPTGSLHWERVGDVLRMVTSSPGYVVYSTF